MSSVFIVIFKEQSKIAHFWGKKFVSDFRFVKKNFFYGAAFFYFACDLPQKATFY